MGVSGQRHSPAALLPPGKGPPVPIGQEAGWETLLNIVICLIYKRKIYFDYVDAQHINSCMSTDIHILTYIHTTYIYTYMHTQFIIS
jgi:hypothetical protein